MSSDDNAEARFTPPAPPSTIDPGDAIASSSTPAWSCTVSVRALCEFTAKHGDLDRRFTPSANALEGLLGHQAVAGRRSQDYPLRDSANEQGVCLRHLRAQRASQAASGEAQGAADR